MDVGLLAQALGSSVGLKIDFSAFSTGFSV